MVYIFLKNTFLLVLITMVSCGRGSANKEISGLDDTSSRHLAVIQDYPVTVGANRLEAYLPLLEGRRVGLVGNQSSVIFHEVAETYTHVVDSLLSRQVNLVKVFAPEHGFRGTADAGEAIKDGRDSSTGLPVISLYGDNKKPTPAQLEGIDILLFDLQDVGTRFYTYISSLHYVMEAAAENNVQVVILDRPNPNGHYVDGPLLEIENQSFVGMHPIPVVHGLTMGEYAQMINGEKWLKKGLQADLQVVTMKNYDRQIPYSLPIKPSPNLPNDQSISLYPSLCFFEGTNVNEGRGTDKQFQVFGSPFLSKAYFDYTYTPRSMEGAKSPKHLNTLCYGRDLTLHPKLDRINLTWLIEAYANTADKRKFFTAFFTKLAGTTALQRQIEAGLTEEEIRATWQENLEKFKQIRKNYLLY